MKKMIALEHEPMAWEAQVKTLKVPVLIITGDADVTTLAYSVAMFRRLGGGGMGDRASRFPPRWDASNFAHGGHHAI